MFFSVITKQCTSNQDPLLMISFSHVVKFSQFMCTLQERKNTLIKYSTKSIFMESFKRDFIVTAAKKSTET